MRKRSTPKQLNVIKTLIILFIIFTISLGFYNAFLTNHHRSIKQTYIAGNIINIPVYNETLKQSLTITRGSKIKLLSKKLNDEKNKIVYREIKYKNKTYFINEVNITSSKKSVVQEKKVFVRTPATIYTDFDKGIIGGMANKGTSLDVISYDKIDENGIVNLYKVKYNDTIGYVYGKYIVFDDATAVLNYEPDKYYNIHQKRGNIYNGGNAGNLDYYPVAKPTFKDNIMPSKLYALYLNSSSNIINNVDAYIEYAKQTKINAFVVDIKDNQSPGYKSKIYEKESSTNFNNASNSLEKYKEAITKIKQAGFYAIGRITVFKDKYYVMDNPDIAIMDSRNGQPYLHANTYWPSPYQRKVWMFNVNLAKEAVSEMGFNEIQFDYVRFPDRTINDEKSGIMDFRNSYNEEKAQAIQRFLMYACDELHKLHVYVSADVFGESAYTYVTAYGQYWAAISNVVDVISGMPYPDHFNKYEFGFAEPVWTTPYKLLNYWASNYVIKRQSEIPTPAIARTWIQVSDVPNYKYAGGFVYGDQQIDEEIRAIVDAGLTGGYMTWLSTSDLNRYKSQINIYSKEY